FVNVRAIDLLAIDGCRDIIADCPQAARAGENNQNEQRQWQELPGGSRRIQMIFHRKQTYFGALPAAVASAEATGCAGAATPACFRAASSNSLISDAGRAPSTSWPLMNMVGVPLTSSDSPSFIEALTERSSWALTQD